MAEASVSALHRRRILTAALVFLGCLFWTLPLSGGLRLVWAYGFFDDAITLVGVPFAMMLVTVLAGWLSLRGRAALALIGGTVIASLAGLWWLAIWGRGV